MRRAVLSAVAAAFAVVALLVTGIAAAAISPTYSINGIGTAANPTQTRLVGTGVGQQRRPAHLERRARAHGPRHGRGRHDHGRLAVGRIPWRRPRRVDPARRCLHRRDDHLQRRAVVARHLRGRRLRRRRHGRVRRLDGDVHRPADAEPPPRAQPLLHADVERHRLAGPHAHARRRLRLSRRPIRPSRRPAAAASSRGAPAHLADGLRAAPRSPSAALSMGSALYVVRVSSGSPPARRQAPAPERRQRGEDDAGEQQHAAGDRERVEPLTQHDDRERDRDERLGQAERAGGRGRDRAQAADEQHVCERRSRRGRATR